MPEEIPAIPARSAPAKIEWVQPDDDIPSEADVLEVLATENMTLAPVVQELSKEVPPASIPVAATKIRWVQPENDVPSETAVSEVPTTEHFNLAPCVLRVPKESPAVPLRSKPIRIDVEKPATPRKRTPVRRIIPEPASEVLYFPTILGDAENKKPIRPDPSEPIFSAYSAASGGRRPAHYRSLLIGGGLVTLIGLFIFGSDLGGREVSVENPRQTVEAQTTVKQEAPPPAETAEVVSVETNVVKSFREPVPEVEDRRTDRPTTPQSKEHTTVTREKLQNTATRKVGKTPLVASTLVISSDSGKIKMKTEPGPNVTTGATRPRIVKNPKP
jgi:hypothetical protein